MESIVCPFCNGAGCQNCQDAGQLQVSSQELQQLQALSQMAPMAQPGMPSYLPQTDLAVSSQKTLPGSRITLAEIKTKLAGFLTLLLIVLLFGGAYLSHQKFHSILPYLAAIASLLVVALTAFISRSGFFQYHEPADFLSFIPKNDLPKMPPVQ